MGIAEGRKVWLALALAGTLAGCEDGGLQLPGFLSADDSAAAAPVTGGTTELVEVDVEAPEVFQVTEAGLWDGRPSLGGVWVAHPDVDDPERVIIRNTENGQFVIGALFRRERESVGPALQVSSDAAEALGMLAGAPAELNVTALRREAASEPAPTDATAPEAVLDEASGGEITTAELDAAPAMEPAPAPAAAPTLAPAPAPASTPAAVPASASPLDRPYIQIGIFSVEENAGNAATAMRANGLEASVIRQESQGTTFWRVVVGPASSTAERDADLETVKGLGFTDAYFTRN
ncbi:SPOR domain-containing protein [Pseudoroseicyclus sp. CLL3-39]|uniref:SPOR domain-containing protein n=2 Tax=Pseudoroseicyclus tamaricis TaxID=2705421 RepID=A0A6B2JPV5_9RHOB|nr:SPOR domain-containing protein [Pseudoroseicyclus tamaricis]NDU99994.1 SPOR domain-containing protein [Pseudoroseicyclus tamaricis]